MTAEKLKREIVNTTNCHVAAMARHHRPNKLQHSSKSSINLFKTIPLALLVSIVRTASTVLASSSYPTWLKRWTVQWTLH